MFIFYKKINNNKGDSMKKYIIIGLLFLFLINIKQKIEPVFNTNNVYSIYYLDFKNTNLNTENFLKYFNNPNIDILKIEPYINPIYKYKFSLTEYLFNYSSKNNNLKTFKKRFLEEIKGINYNDYSLCVINGIKIDMVKVYTTKEEIDKLLKLDNNVKYMFNYTDYSEI